MKILHVYKVYYPENNTGVPQVIRALCNGMSEFDIQSHVLTTVTDRCDEVIEFENHLIHPVPSTFSLFSTNFSRKMFSKYRALSNNCDIIHFHYPWPFADIVQTAARVKTPYVITYHSDIVGQKFTRHLYAPLMHKFLSGAEYIVATSDNYAESSPILKKYKDKTITIPIGIDDAKTPESELISKWRDRLGEGFYLFIGAPRYYKGIEYLLAAAERSRLPVVFAGKGMAGISSQNPIPENVTILDSIDEHDKSAILALCNALVLPSHLRSEAFGVVLLEAARAGKPLISCEIGSGTSYVNINQITGLVVPPMDAYALANAMLSLDENPLMRHQFGEQARKRYLSKFTATKMCLSYLSLYAKLASTKERI